MDSASAKILMEMYLPVLVCYAVLAVGFQFLRSRRAKGKPPKAASAFGKIVLWISIGMMVVFFIVVSQIAKAINF